jgi:serine protease Do
MKLFRSHFFTFILAAAAAVFSLDTTRADEAKTFTPVPNAPDFSKDPPLPEAFDKKYPDGIEDLRAIQNQVKLVLKKVIPATVCVQVGSSSGSGVIVSEDGVILTAGHVSGKPDQSVTVIMPDGTRHKGKTLGNNKTIDSGMIKITDEGKYPFVELGKSADLKKGQWCIVTGHPGGYKEGRSPVVRVGHILELEFKAQAAYVRTDCTLVGGDSGGPLFDMNGRVIGIHSRIGPQITSNMHVPVDTFRETWDRLVKSEAFGGVGLGYGPSDSGQPYFGFQLDQVDKDCKIIDIVKDSPAEKAGLKIDDVIKKFDGKDVANVDLLRELFEKKKPNEEAMFEIQRGKETLKLKVVVGKKT